MLHTEDEKKWIIELERRKKQVVAEEENRRIAVVRPITFMFSQLLKNAKPLIGHKRFKKRKSLNKRYIKIAEEENVLNLFKEEALPRAHKLVEFHHVPAKRIQPE